MTLYEQWRDLIENQTDASFKDFGQNTVRRKQDLQ